MIGYEFLPWIHGGAGVQFSLLERLQLNQNAGLATLDADGNCTLVETNSFGDLETLVSGFSTDVDGINLLEPSLFTDVNIGLKNVRIGSRYYFNFGKRFGIEEDPSIRQNVQIYAEIRF